MTNERDIVERRADAALRALMNYEQADMDGIMVLASRQAIHEVHDEITRLRAANKELVAALDAAETMLRVCPRINTNAMGKKPTMTTERALVIARAALSKYGEK